MATGANQRPQAGFSLIELMIALAIIGILAAVAYPAYTAHIKRGHRSEAYGMMVAITASMEAYASTQGSYNVADLVTLHSLSNNANTESDAYDFALTNTVASYSIKATPKAGGPLASEGAIIIYWDGRKGWDSDDDGTYEAIDF